MQNDMVSEIKGASHGHGHYNSIYAATRTRVCHGIKVSETQGTPHGTGTTTEFYDMYMTYGTTKQTSFFCECHDVVA